MMINEKTEKMWNDFDQIKREGKTPKDVDYISLRNALIEEYYPLVFKMAKKFIKKLRDVQEDDLVSWGTDGLFNAVEKFEISRGNQFQTYAEHRIRGAILDNIRNVDWIPRLVRQRASKMEKLRQKHEISIGRRLTNNEMADIIGVTEEEFIDISKKSIPVNCVSIFSKVDDSANNYGSYGSYDISDEEKNPLDGMLRHEMFQKLLGSNFTKLERNIILLHYKENYTMKEIASMKGFSESRISQLHANVLLRLQEKVERNPSYAFDLLQEFSS